MIRAIIKASNGLPGPAPLFFAICCCIITPIVCHSSEYKSFKASQQYVFEKLNSHGIVFLGTTHQKPTILKFVAGLIPLLKNAGVTRVALEIPTDQQGDLDSYITTGASLSNIYVHPQIDCPEYRVILTTLHSLESEQRPSVVAVDLPKSMYKGKISRNEWMAKTIAAGITRDNNAKTLVVLGNFHAFKKIEWQDHFPGKMGSVPEYLNRVVSNRSMFSIGQLIDEDPGECDFTKEFSPIEGAVAVDCDGEKFKGWKIGVTSAIAIKNTEPCQLFDGLIVY